jgi:hypothetical protein
MPGQGIQGKNGFFLDDGHGVLLTFAQQEAFYDTESGRMHGSGGADG